MYEIMNPWNSIKTNGPSIWSAEKAEAEDCFNKVKEHYACDDEQTFTTQLTQIGTDLESLIPQIDAIFKGTFEQNKDVAKKLLAQKDAWNEVRTKVTTVRENVETHLEMDDWGGAGGEEYKNVLPTQKKALQELSGLATAQSMAVDQAGTMNAWIYQRTRDSVLDVKEYMPEGYSKKSVEGGFWTRPTVGGTPWDQYEYAKHTMTLVNNLKALKTWLDKVVDPYASDWASAAQRLTTDIDTVTNAPVNLQDSGQWPGITMRVEADAANTSALGYNSGYVGGNYDTGDGEGIDMNI
ncbi:hypothetical protein [Aestuariimicrobium ganziense]|uniref:hypothetical protein n=1 Tax=Aestuariimicrobium ganziense TaxID=2773677 RepID=UPI001940430A|nr:hypothetical protein [Aestuariimicrobium ganziense]